MYSLFFTVLFSFRYFFQCFFLAVFMVRGFQHGFSRWFLGWFLRRFFKYFFRQFSNQEVGTASWRKQGHFTQQYVVFTIIEWLQLLSCFSEDPTTDPTTCSLTAHILYTHRLAVIRFFSFCLLTHEWKKQEIVLVNFRSR